MAAIEDAAAVPRPPLAYRLTERQWLAIDVVAALLAMCFAVFNLHLLRGFRFEVPGTMTAPAVLGGLAVTLPVAVRRIWPVPVLIVVATAVAWLTAVDRAQLGVDVMLGMAIYMVAVRSSRRVAVAALIGTEVAIVAGLMAASVTSRGPADTAHSLLAAGAMWFVGTGVRERQKYLAGLAEQAALREQAEAERSRQAVRQERVRIARELHDVVAHSLSVVTFQAGVGRKVGAAKPAEALMALRAVEVTGRGALEELRRILGLLRDDDGEGPSLVPAPGVGDLEELAGTVRAAGITVRLMVTGDVAALPPAASLTVYRIVQEALTNVVKHAPGAEAQVRVRASRDGVQITVTDNGRAAAPHHDGHPHDGQSRDGQARDGQGAARHGLVGMRERAAAFGGTLEAGPAVGGGFHVSAFLPAPGHSAGQVA